MLVQSTNRWSGSIAVLATFLLVAIPALLAPSAQAAPSGYTNWLCHPSKVNDPCDLPDDTTDLGTGKVTPATKVTDADRKVDCFYVYPTVTDQLSLVADRVAAPEVKSIASFQAARFNTQCRVFAPVYRQMTLFGLTPAAMAAWVGNRDLAKPGYSDVLRAWKEYLRNDNHGRGVIFIGHSQGTMMLRKLIREQIDPNPALRKKVVGAFLIGGNVMTAPGETTGGDFTNIPVCTRKAQSGCVIAYSTDIIGLPSLFGNSTLDQLSAPMGLPFGPRLQVACTDPSTIAGDRSPVGVTAPSAPFAFGIISVLMQYTTFPEPLPTSASTWTTTRGRVIAKCTDVNGFHRLHATIVRRQAVNEVPMFDTHLLDMNAGLDLLVSIARKQIESYGA